MKPTQIFELRLRKPNGNRKDIIESVLRLPIDKVKNINRQLGDRNNEYIWKQFKK